MKRRIMLAIAAVVALSFAIAGCSSDAGSTSSAPDDRTLDLAFIGEMGYAPDPDVAYLGGNALNIINNTYEGLVRQALNTDETQIEPWLATSWESNEDATEWTFYLRDDVYFHDGTQLTSADVAPSVQRRQDLAQGAAYVVADVVDVQTPDDFTVVFVLSASNAEFADIQASPFGLRILNSAALAENAGDDNAQTYLQDHDLGSGPYELTSAQPSVGYTMEYSEHWWGEEPEFTTINYTVEQNSAAVQLKFGNNEIDIIQSGLTGAAFESYKTEEGVSTYTLPLLRVEMMHINSSSGPFQDAEFRQAFRQFIDRDGLTEQIWQGNASPASTMYGLGSTPLVEDSATYDPSKLESLVAALPEDERAITIAYTASNETDSQLVNTLAVSLEEIGLNVSIETYTSGAEWADWQADLTNAPSLTVGDYFPDGYSPYLWSSLYWTSTAGLNVFKCEIEDADELTAEGAATGDDAVWTELGEAADASGCYTNIAYLNDLMVSQDWLTGVEEAHDITAPAYLDFTKLGIAE